MPPNRDMPDNIKHPRIKKGRITPAYKEGKPGEIPDFLISNTYFSTFLKSKPPYWDDLLRVLYYNGRLVKYASGVEDIVDKFSFLFLSRDKINQYEELQDWSKCFYIKFLTYSFIYLTKSFLDSLAVFVNEIFDLGYKAGEIDFKKGKFINSIKNKNEELGQLIFERHKWINTVVKYRNNLIHRHGLYVGPLTEIPPYIKDQNIITSIILKEPFYLPNNPDLVDDLVHKNREGELIKLSCFIDDWIKESAVLLDIVLGTFATSFTRASWIFYPQGP
jgi:Cthe_2314-like HEPN